MFAADAPLGGARLAPACVSEKRMQWCGRCRCPSVRRRRRRVLVALVLFSGSGDLAGPALVGGSVSEGAPASARMESSTPPRSLATERPMRSLSFMEVSYQLYFLQL